MGIWQVKLFGVASMTAFWYGCHTYAHVMHSNTGHRPEAQLNKSEAIFEILLVVCTLSASGFARQCFCWAVFCSHG